MNPLIGLGVIIGFMFVMGWAFRYDLKEMEATHPKYREYLRKRYKW